VSRGTPHLPALTAADKKANRDKLLTPHLPFGGGKKKKKKKGLNNRPRTKQTPRALLQKVLDTGQMAIIEYAEN